MVASSNSNNLGIVGASDLVAEIQAPTCRTWQHTNSRRVTTATGFPPVENCRRLFHLLSLLQLLFPAWPLLQEKRHVVSYPGLSMASLSICR